MALLLSSDEIGAVDTNPEKDFKSTLSSSLIAAPAIEQMQI